MGIDQYDAGKREDRREPIPVGSYVIEPRSEGRCQALRYDMLASHVGSMEDVLQAIAVDVAVRQDAIDADRAAMGASIQSAPSSPVDRWLTASAELPAALRAVTPEDLAAWLEAHGWTPIEDAPGDWMSPDGLHQIILPQHSSDRTVRTWQALEDIGRWVAGVMP
jgi:hypothetical protein